MQFCKQRSIYSNEFFEPGRCFNDYHCEWREARSTTGDTAGTILLQNNELDKTKA
ncbi:hypothetical protein HK096_003290, partial [Nowakowskiella sp. JEL0078]